MPEGVSIVNFDDTDPIVTDLDKNTLTMVRIPLHQIDQEILRGVVGDAADVQNTVFPVELISGPEFGR